MATTDYVGLMTRLGQDFATRSAAHDEDDTFVAENYAALKDHGAFAAGVPAELGGGGATHAELCAMVRELARHCSSTALAFSMHTHLVATQAFLWRGGNKAPEPLLRRVAADGVVLATSGGADFLDGSGRLEKVDGGWRLTARKAFVSGGPGADLFLTTGIYDDPQAGPTVIHLVVPSAAEGVKLVDTWRALGMRGTGSHDLVLESVFVSDAATSVRRPAGKWHPAMHAIVFVALPIIAAAYLGAAQAARQIALRLAEKRKADPLVAVLVGELENHFVAAELAFASLVDLVATRKPGAESTAAALARRTIGGQAVVRTVEKALEVAGGAGFYRAAGLERLFRDVQASRYHPLPEKPQTRLTGRLLLGLELDG
jgi:acyl-CoA dehydrogenase